MVSLFHVFQKLDRAMRNRPDAQRWRVTMSEHNIEIWRRPVLTSAVTLAAIGIGSDAVPTPELLCCITLSESAGAEYARIQYPRHPESDQFVEAQHAHLAPQAYIARIADTLD
jgi:hypothetical protein